MDLLHLWFLCCCVKFWLNQIWMRYAVVMYSWSIWWTVESCLLCSPGCNDGWWTFSAVCKVRDPATVKTCPKHRHRRLPTNYLTTNHKPIYKPTTCHPSISLTSIYFPTIHPVPYHPSANLPTYNLQTIPQLLYKHKTSLQIHNLPLNPHYFYKPPSLRCQPTV